MIALLASLLCVPALAQPPAPPSANPPAIAPQPLDVSPATPWRQAQHAYEAEPTSDRVSVTVRSGDRAAPAHSFILRIDPGSEHDHRAPQTLIELGRLRLYASAGKLVAIMPSVPDTFCQLDYEGDLTAETLARLTPPLPLPQLALLATKAGDRPGERPDLVPYAPRVAWSAATLDQNPKNGPSLFTVTGSSPAGAAKAVIDATTGRLRQLIVDAAPSTKIELTIDAVPITDPATWPIDTSKRRRVDTLTALDQPAALKDGQTLPTLAAKTLDGADTTLAAGLAPADKPGPHTAIVLLLRPDPADADATSAALARLQAARAAAKDAAPIVLMLSATATIDKALLDVIAAGLPSLAERPAPLLLTAPRAPYAQVCPAAPAAIFTIDSAGKLTFLPREDAPEHAAPSSP